MLRSVPIRQLAMVGEIFERMSRSSRSATRSGVVSRGLVLPSRAKTPLRISSTNRKLASSRRVAGQGVHHPARFVGASTTPGRSEFESSNIVKHPAVSNSDLGAPETQRLTVRMAKIIVSLGYYAISSVL